MKKALTLATIAVLLVAGSASAQWGRHPVATVNATFAPGTGAFSSAGPSTGPTSTNNDDTCDIASAAPAATLLLPYFEVETATRGTTTFFEVTNTSRFPQVAHVTVWTDWSFPVLDFNIFLTGFDVQPIDLFDVIVNSQINGTTGTSSSTAAGKVFSASTGLALSPQPGSFALSGEAGNPNFGANPGGGNAGCANLPGQFNTDIGKAVQNALVNGIYNSPGFNPSTGAGNGCTNSQQVGSAAGHNGTTSNTTAIGYVTIDVAAICSTKLPTDTTYFSQEILFDNVLTGDYQIINKATGNNFAGGEALVHIRAIPEGGAAGTVPPGVSATNMPYTFYSRYINGVAGTVLNQDRRQPLPSVWAARYIFSATGNPATGIPPLDTRYRVWREGVTGPATPAAAGASPFQTATACGNMTANSALPIQEIVRFDEHENAVVITAIQGVSPNLGSNPPTLPETSARSVSDTSVFPQIPAAVSGDAGGWMYLNLNAFTTAFGSTAGAADFVNHPGIVRASQNWVIVAESGGTGAGASAGQFSVDFNATWLGNGCSGRVGTTTLNGGANVLGPVGGAVTGTNVTP